MASTKETKHTRATTDACAQLVLVHAHMDARTNMHASARTHAMMYVILCVHASMKQHSAVCARGADICGPTLACRTQHTPRNRKCTGVCRHTVQPSRVWQAAGGTHFVGRLLVGPRLEERVDRRDVTVLGGNVEGGGAVLRNSGWMGTWGGGGRYPRVAGSLAGSTRPPGYNENENTHRHRVPYHTHEYIRAEKRISKHECMQRV